MKLTKIGTFSAPNGATVVAFAAGYVAFGAIDDQETFATWFSTDGRAWRRTVHSTLVVPCPGWSPRSNLQSVYNGTVVNHELVIVASLVAPTATGCDRHRLVALVTSDGTSWQQSAAFGPPTSGMEWSEEAWAIPHGVEVKVSQQEDRWSIWRSSDGFHWDEVSSGPAPIEADFHVFGTDQHGTRLAVRRSDETSAAVLVASDDGLNWRKVRTLPIGYGVVSALPPHEGGETWLVAIARDDDEVQVLRSTNLAAWDTARFPRSAIGSLLPTSEGWLAIGSRASSGLAGGPPGPPPNPALYTSSDGAHWTKSTTRIGDFDVSFVDGPAGILAITVTPTNSLVVSQVALP